MPMKTGMLVVFALTCLLCHATASGTPDLRWMQRSQQTGLAAFQKKAYRQLALLRIARSTYPGPFGGPDLWSIAAGSEMPFRTLSKMGMNILPILVEALDDATPTLCVTASRNLRGKDKIWKVNEFVALLIVGAASRNFVTGKYPNEQILSQAFERSPELAPQFQKIVLDWYAKNRNKTLKQRKIEETEDSWFRNRFDAVALLGTQKIRAGRTAIEASIDRTLAVKEGNSLIETEAAQNAFALAQIGDGRSLPHVRRVCRYLSEGMERNNIRHSSVLPDLFQAHHARAMLGEKAQAIENLENLYRKCSPQMRPSEPKEYRKRMQEAKKW